MLGENHSLLNEFPEYKEQIHHLKVSDEEFAEMARQYHDLDHQIRGLEKREVPTTDDCFEQLKLQRVQLKDKLYQKIINGA